MELFVYRCFKALELAWALSSEVLRCGCGFCHRLFESAVALTNLIRVSMASRGQRGLPVRWDPPSKRCSLCIGRARMAELSIWCSRLCHPNSSEAEMVLATNLHQQKVQPGSLGRVLVSAVAALAIGVVCSTAARAQNEALVKAGLEVWRSSGRLPRAVRKRRQGTRRGPDRRRYTNFTARCRGAEAHDQLWPSRRRRHAGL
jgi:hypothetical protein